MLLAQGVFGSFGIAAPFSDGRLHWNWGPPFWLFHAQQINSVGLVGARFGVVSDVVVRGGKTVANGFYQSHPQLIGPVVALWTRFFGYEEWSIRLLALVLTMATTIFLWLAIRKLFSTRVAHSTSILWAMMPIIAVYGRKLDQEPLVLFFLVLALFGFAHVRQTTGRPWLFFFGLICACLSDWSGFVFAACLSATCFLFGKKEDRPFVIAGGAAIIGGLVVLFLQLAAQQAVTHTTINFVSLYQFRSEAAAPSVAAWFWKQWQYLVDNFGILAAVIFPLAIWFFVGRSSSERSEGRLPRALFGAIIIGQLAYLAVVPQAAAIHGYFQYYFSLPLAVGLALVFERMRFHRRGAGSAGVLFVFCLALQLVGTGLLWAQIRHAWYGDATDVALLRHIIQYPQTTKVKALGGPQGWFDNPNIRYYAGRNISVATPGALPLPDVYVVTKEGADALVDRLRIAAIAPKPMPVRRECSTHFCLVETYGH